MRLSSLLEHSSEVIGAYASSLIVLVLTEADGKLARSRLSFTFYLSFLLFFLMLALLDDASVFAVSIFLEFYVQNPGVQEYQLHNYCFLKKSLKKIYRAHLA